VWQHFKIMLGFVAAMTTLPLTFFGIIFGWCWIDQVIGYRDVSAFIQQHRQLVDKWRGHPKVHSFSLSHDPEFTGGLLIQIDVDDKRTYEQLEDILFHETSGMRSETRWETKLRSNEDLGNNWGFAAAGMSGVVEGFSRLLIASVASPLVCGFSIWLVFRERKNQNDGTVMVP